MKRSPNPATHTTKAPAAGSGQREGEAPATKRALRGMSYDEGAAALAPPGEGPPGRSGDHASRGRCRPPRAPGGGRRGRADAMRAAPSRAAFFAPATVGELVAGVAERVAAGHVLTAVGGLRLYLQRERHGASGPLLERAEALHARAQILAAEVEVDELDVAGQDAALALVTERLLGLVHAIRAQAGGDSPAPDGVTPVSREATLAGVAEAVARLDAAAIDEAEASLRAACAAGADPTLQGELLVIMARLAVFAAQVRAGVLDAGEIATTGGAIGASLAAIVAGAPPTVEAMTAPESRSELTATLRGLAGAGQLPEAAGLLVGWAARDEGVDAVARYHVDAVEAEMNAVLRGVRLGTCTPAQVDERLASLAQVIGLLADDLDAPTDEAGPGGLVSPTPDEVAAGAERGIWQQTIPRVIAIARARGAALSLFAPVGPDRAPVLLEIAPDAEVSRLREEVELRYAKGRVDADGELTPNSRTRDRLSADERALQDERLRHNPHAADADRLAGVSEKATELKSHRAGRPRGDDRVLPTVSELHLELRADFPAVFQRFIAPRLIRVARGRGDAITYEHPATSPVALTVAPDDTVASLCARYPDLVGPLGVERSTPAAGDASGPQASPGSDHVHSTRSDARWATTALPEALERARALGRPVTVTSQYVLETFWKVPRAELHLLVRPDEAPAALARRAHEFEARLRRRALEVGDSDLAADEVDVDAAFNRTGAHIATRLSPTVLHYACNCAVSQDQPVRLRAFVDEEGQWVELMVRPGDAPSDLMVRLWDTIRAQIRSRLAHNEVGVAELGVDGVPLGEALRGAAFKRLLDVAQAQREAVFVRIPAAGGAEVRFEVWPGDRVADALARAAPLPDDLDAPIALTRDRHYQRISSNESASGSTREVHAGTFGRR